MHNLCYFVGLCIATGVCSILLFGGVSNTNHFPTKTNHLSETTAPTTQESSSSATKTAMFDAHRDGHKMLPVNSHSSLEKVQHHKVSLPRRSHTLLEKDPKEAMAKENHHSHSDRTSGRGSNSNSNNNSNSIVYLPPIWDAHGASQQIHRKLHKLAIMVKGEEGRYGRHQKKKMEHEYSLYYGEELTEARESFLRGAHRPSK